MAALEVGICGGNPMPPPRAFCVVGGLRVRRTCAPRASSAVPTWAGGTGDRASCFRGALGLRVVPAQLAAAVLYPLRSGDQGRAHAEAPLRSAEAS